MKRIIILVITLTIALALIAGCGGGGGGTGVRPSINGTLKVTVTLPTSRSISIISQVVKFRATVSAPGISTIVQDIPIDQATHTGTGSIEVPAGTGRQLLVEALDKDNVTIFKGQTAFDINALETKQVDILLDAINGSVQVTVVVHQGFPSIAFTTVPPIGSYAALQGSISGGSNPNKLAVVVYIKVGNGWWTKPYFDTPVTLPNADGSWICAIATGGSDATATEIFAYLVRQSDYDNGNNKPPAARGGGLPVITNALATADVTRS